MVSKRVLRKFKHDIESAKQPVTVDEILRTYDDIEGFLEGDYMADESMMRDLQLFIVRMHTFYGSHKYIVTIEPDETEKQDVPNPKWIYVEDSDGDHHCECPVCGEYACGGGSFYDLETPFCPYCGTALDKSGDGGESV